MNEGATERSDRCPRCGSARHTARAGGLCARCLLSSALDDDEDDGAEDAAGRHAPLIIGGYRLLGEIARGGAGVVHRAWQPALKREVALKRVLSARLENRESLDRFQREAELMAGLDHPGILPVYEIGLHEGVPWFSMKLAERGNLAERAATLRGRYDEIARVLVRVARAVQHAHDRGVLHRDLKPSNIVFDREGQPLVTDFGLARRLSVDSTLTGADALIGTPRYVAPEMIATPGAKLTIAVDVYGLGAILYELLTGAPPFSELAPLQVLRHIATLRPQRPRRIDASIPPELESICLRCLEKRPADRYPSADALADALQTWLAGTRRSRFPARLRWLKLEVPSRRRRAAVEATLVLVAGFVAAAVWLASREPISIPDPASALRTVAVLPDLLKDTPSEREAARHLAARLQLPSSLRLLPFDAALATAASHNPLDSDADVDAALGAFIVVVVATQDDAQKFALVAVDDLREERLYETSFVAADEPRVARELAAALAEKRGRPTAEAHLSRSALALLLRAIRLLQSPGQGTNALAIAALKDMIGQAPDSAVAHAWLAYAYLGHGGEAFWTDSAIDEAARAQRMDPTLGLAAKQLGLAYQQKGWLARALPAYEQARALGSLYVENSLGFVYYTAGRFADAYQLSLERQRFGTTDPFPQVLAAHVLLDVGETDAGERALRVANGKEPKAALRALTEAEIAWYRDDYATCRERAGRIEPGIPELYDGFFTPTGLIRACAIEQGDFAAALATMEMSKRAYAGNNGAASAGVSPALREAILLTQLKRTDTVPALLGQARQSLQAAIDGSSDYPPVWLRMAAAQRLGGEVDAAYTTLEHAFALGLTVNNRNRSDVEFLPFQGDARFESLRARSEDYVAGQREKVAQQLDPAMRERVSSGPHDANRDAAGAAKASAPDGKANPS